ncbi:hypothetical protein NUW58_g10711 [Xylaria curta]|uniref:Uncharacterized protein n=1 Tax=Xylaria curta TaxID=42375 RepID=A0ACC1MHX0_9PEZI|nr:hypothetical protein NUW58_g10711 [Xylaria curta]
MPGHLSGNHPATEVYVTGTFDDWKKTEKLEKVGDGFQKTVALPDISNKITYKVRRFIYGHYAAVVQVFIYLFIASASASASAMLGVACVQDAREPTSRYSHGDKAPLEPP